MADGPKWLKTAHKNAGWVVAFGVLTIILGVVAIFSPLAGGLAATMVVGVAMLIGGVSRLVVAFSADSFGSGALAFIWGLLVAVAGFYIITDPGMGLATLTLVLAVMFFASGLTESVVAFQVKPAQGWGWLLFGGIVSILLAFMVWRQFPFSGEWLVGTLVGIHLIFSGMTAVFVGRGAQKLTDLG